MRLRLELFVTCTHGLEQVYGAVEAEVHVVVTLPTPVLLVRKNLVTGHSFSVKHDGKAASVEGREQHKGSEAL